MILEFQYPYSVEKLKAKIVINYQQTRYLDQDQ
jgi:hypothetical protein